MASDTEADTLKGYHRRCKDRGGGALQPDPLHETFTAQARAQATETHNLGSRRYFEASLAPLRLLTFTSWMLAEQELIWLSHVLQ